MSIERRRWLIAADDITGAAEVAGAARSMGHAVRIVRHGADVGIDVGSTLVILDTDSRSLTAECAASRVTQLLRPWIASGWDLGYKKTDSVLRGNVAAEVQACLAATGKSSAVLLPVNPARGRTIQDGVLLVGGVPLHETEFSRDPEHPATVSDVRQLLNAAVGGHEHVSSPHDHSGARVLTSDVVAGEDLRHWAKCLRRDQLAAGGVEFFRAWLEHHSSQGSDSPAGVIPMLEPPLLAVCGSRSIGGRLACDQLVRSGGVPLSAPHDLTAPRLSSRRCGRWAKSAAETLDRAALVVMETGRLHADPAGVRNAVGASVAQVLSNRRVNSLLIEGGATASAILSRMDWNRLEVLGELDTGVVMLRAGPGMPLLILKPGTYRWPTALLEQIERVLTQQSIPGSR